MGMEATRSTRPWWTSITTQVWVLVLMCAVLLSGLIVLNTKADVGRERKIVNDELERQGEDQIANMMTSLGAANESWGDSIKQITSQPALVSLGPNCGAPVDQMQRLFGSYGTILVVDAKGVVRCAGGQYASRAGSALYAGEPSVLAAIAAGKQSTVGPVRDPITGVLSISMVIPLQSREKAALLYSFGTQASLAPEGRDTDLAYAAFDSRDGTILMHYPAIDGVVGQKIADTDLAGAVSPGKDLASATGPDGVRRLYRTMQVTGTPYRLIVGEDAGKAFAAARDSLVRNVLIGLALLVAVALMGFLLQRRVARPARALRSAILALGSDPNAPPAPTDGPVELAEVAQAFNTTVAARRRADGLSRAIVEHASDLLLVLGADGTVSYLGPTARRLLGVLEGATATSLLELVHPDDRDGLAARVAEWLADGGIDLSLELRVEDTVGGFHHLDAHVQDLRHDPDIRGVAIAARDVTERMRFEEHLAHQARHDALTGLYNRAAVLERLGTCLDLEDGESVYVLFVDLDRFKLVNDSHGHAVGDLVLIALADKLSDMLGLGDMLGRFGGDEFVLVARSPRTLDEARALAQQARAALSEPLTIAGREMFISGSIGIALATPGDSPEVVLRNADTAMYRAKANGRNCAALFDEQMRAEAQRLRRTENDLHRALERGQMRVHYQPVVDMTGGGVVGAEALVRWEHPERGLISPADFIPVAEETGLIVPLGAWVLEQACSWAASQSNDSLRVSVNVSARQLAQPDVVQMVRSVLQQTGLAPDRLTLEVTESLLVKDAEQSADTLQALKDFGVRISIDDFGTGWSSLTYLQQFPVDEIKLDRSYVSKVDGDAASAAIVGALIGMAHTLELTVTAEGVETPAQAEFLQQQDCDTAQGYLFARPLPEDQLSLFLRRPSGLVIPMPRQAPRSSSRFAG